MTATPTSTPVFVRDFEWTEVEFFVACDPLTSFEEEGAEVEVTAALSGAFLGALGFEGLHHLLEGLDHIAGIQDALRPKIPPQALRQALVSFQRNPVPCPPGQTPGVWVRVPVRRAVLRQVIAYAAPGNRIVPAPAVTKRPVPNWRPRLVPSWAR